MFVKILLAIGISFAIFSTLIMLACVRLSGICERELEKKTATKLKIKGGKNELP